MPAQVPKPNQIIKAVAKRIQLATRSATHSVSHGILMLSIQSICKPAGLQISEASVGVRWARPSTCRHIIRKQRSYRRELIVMASTLSSELTGNPELIEVVDDRWLSATLPDDGEVK